VLGASHQDVALSSRSRAGVAALTHGLRVPPGLRRAKAAEPQGWPVGPPPNCEPESSPKIANQGRNVPDVDTAGGHGEAAGNRTHSPGRRSCQLAPVFRDEGFNAAGSMEARGGLTSPQSLPTTVRCAASPTERAQALASTRSDAVLGVTVDHRVAWHGKCAASMPFLRHHFDRPLLQ